ncbi:stage V sporulation protein AF [Desulfofundulus australicus DSM 11792]|uniref:Stage V sporulation protein AF n=1 Tax=Desulfofundulus australicus DSM 11792 TaxID=1121425 RepID=A0A1M5CK53_9FIRM|nr:spore germination protein [Desulfofundulus australicus]SHF55081.1 stage V sporulation protein AF [Desulfofundulus australicus DSM 11792]
MTQQMADTGQQAVANGNKTPVKKRLEENTEFLKKALGIGESFDIILRELNIGGVKAALVFVDGLTNDQIFTLILEHLAELEREGMTINTFRKLFYRHVPYTEVSEVGYLEDVVEKVLSGPQALLIDGEEKAIIIDARIYPVRQPEEPDLERVVRGSRDGFTETLVYNTALIRRRLRDPRLRMEILQAGNRSKTDIVVCFLQDVANPDLVDSVKEKIKSIDIDGLPMAEKAVEELITPGSYWNPFPRVRYTERPDVAAMHLLEGHVLVLVDTSPSVAILPATYFHHLQHAEEYRQSPAVGVWLRTVRFVGVAISIFLLPLWLLAALHPELLPPALKFIGPKKIGAIPLVLQFIIAEFAVDMVRLATIHTPTGLSVSISLIAALLIGDIAVSVGLFAPEVILYTAIAATGIFLTPSYELSQANRLVRLFLLAAVIVAGLPGFILAVLITFAFLAATRSFGVPYLWPLIPFNWMAMKKVLVRSPVPVDNIRPSILKPRDKYRQSVPEPARKR